MCGINGLFAYHPAASAPDEAELIATRDHMRARGPDGHGAWWSANRRLGLGHRRLSILDVSARADQPMVSADGRYVVVFNGEIYNAPALRRDLEGQGRTFRTTSDTEVLLHLYQTLGTGMLGRLRGMFAFAIWDTREECLFLARDPYGIKPLYTANDGWTMRFASQVKALLSGGNVSRSPEPAGTIGFYLWGSVPEPFTLYQDIRSLPAGYSQYIDSAGPREPQPFASIAAAFAEGARNPAVPSEAAGIVRSAVLDSVSAHLLADVEVGVFLSAGVDSGAVLGLMRDAGHESTRAITLAFEEYHGTADDESLLAAEVAQKYGARHCVRTVSRSEFESDLPALLDAMDQPSIDGINTWFVAKAAREAGLKVALSGLGGDELLAGYASFRQIPKLVRWLALPARIPGAGRAVRGLLRRSGVARRWAKAPGMLEYGGTFARAYLLRRALFLPFELEEMLDGDLVRHGLRRLAPIRRLQSELDPMPRSELSRVAALESVNYLRNQLLRDADWAGMAHSIEIRTPLVDWQLLCRLARVVPFLGAGQGKRALAGAPNSPLPDSIVNRAKTGFVVPTRQWRSGTSRSWAREMVPG